jgi:hypothetical protein
MLAAPPTPTVTVAIESYAPIGAHADGVTELLAELAAEFPFAFVATAVNVYSVPFVSPVTVTGELPDAVMLSGDDVTVYPVIDDPPVAFAVIVISACASPPVTEDIVGACGTLVAVTEDEAELAEDVP